MHWLDITLLVVLGLGAVLGARSGLLWQVARLVTFAAALYVSIYYHEPLTTLLTTYVQGVSPLLLQCLAYVVSFLGIYLVGYAITLLLQRGLKASRLKRLDRILGAVLGLVKAGLLAGTIFMVLAIFPTPQTDAALSQSFLASGLLQVMRGAVVAVPQQYKDDFNTGLERIKKVGAEKAGEFSDAATRKAIEEQLQKLSTAPADKKDTAADKPSAKSASR